MVAVQPRREHALHAAARAAFVPELAAAAAPEVRLARSQRGGERLGVGVGYHEDLAAGGVLHHAGHEAVAVVAHEVEEGL